MKLLRDLILEGKIPYYRIIKKVALVLSFLPVPIYLLFKISPRDYGELGWNFLIAIMLIRPLADVLPGLKILRPLTTFRKEFGIAAAWMMILHGFGAFARDGKNIFIEIFKPEYWQLKNPLMWGILGFLIVIILLFTSNNLSIRILKSNWKRIQRLAYALFFFSAAHIALIKRGDLFETLLPVLIVMVLWTLATLKVKIPLFVPPQKTDTK
jgi:methionine sulfoxide reductase heme-binding subunit